MKHLLHVNASPRGTDSQSLALAETFLETFGRRNGKVEVDKLDLFEEPLPAFGNVSAAAKVTVFSGQEPEGEQARMWAQARVVFERFARADGYVFNVPMWNAGVPYVLKQWIDIVTQPGWAFGFHPVDGYTGLLTGKKAAVVYTSGVYAPGVPPQFGLDFHSTFFNDWLRFVGITDVTEIRLAANAMTADLDGELHRARLHARDVALAF